MDFGADMKVDAYTEADAGVKVESREKVDTLAGVRDEVELDAELEVDIQEKTGTGLEVSVGKDEEDEVDIEGDEEV